MRRIGLAVVLALSLLAPLDAEAQEPQTGKMSRVGRLTPTTAAISTEANDGFREGMRALGWAEGKSYIITPPRKMTSARRRCSYLWPGPPSAERIWVPRNH